MLTLVNCAGMPLRVRKESILAYWKCNGTAQPRCCILVGGCSNEWHLMTEFEELQAMIDGPRQEPPPSLDMGVKVYG